MRRFWNEFKVWLIHTFIGLIVVTVLVLVTVFLSEKVVNAEGPLGEAAVQGISYGLVVFDDQGELRYSVPGGGSGTAVTVDFEGTEQRQQVVDRRLLRCGEGTFPAYQIDEVPGQADALIASGECVVVVPPSIEVGTDVVVDLYAEKPTP